MMKIDCEQCRIALIDQERGELPDDTAAALRTHLEQCPACAEEQMHLIALWQLLDREERPGPALRARVMNAAEQLLARRAPTRLAQWFQAIWPSRPVWAACYSLVLLSSGVVTGQLLPQGALGITDASSAEMTREALLQICPVRDV